MARQLTEQDGRAALRDHVLDRASSARARHGPLTGIVAVLALLNDREAVRYPLGLRFDATPLQAGEFACLQALGGHPREGFCLFMHPMLEELPALLPLAAAYYIPAVNYGDIATPEDCEAYGAVLCGLNQDEYYAALCCLSDSIWPARASEP